MLPDYHIHTTLCKHATGDVADYIARARTLCLPEICFTDHAPSPDGYDEKHRMDMSQFHAYRAMAQSQQAENEPEVLFGIEADYYEGCETFLRDWLPAQDFDFVLGSVHYIESWGFDNPSFRHIWDSVDVKETWKKYFGLIEKLADLRLFDAVSHLDLTKKYGYRPSEKELKEIVQPALDRVAKAGMGMELNTSGLEKPVKEIYPSQLIASLAFEREIPICFGSDAHAPEQVGRNFDLALKLAREAGYSQYFKIRRRVKEANPLPEELPMQP